MKKYIDEKLQSEIRLVFEKENNKNNVVNFFKLHRLMNKCHQEIRK